MISLNDYLYSGNTVLKIMKQYTDDLKENAAQNHNSVDIAHCDLLIQMRETLIHNEFLTQQSQRIKELYIYMTKEYPFLAFTFKGRIKSLIRAEEKINAYIVEFIRDYYRENGAFPTEAEIKSRLRFFRDFIAYRIVISLPMCQVGEGESRKEREINYLYEIANILPGFLKERGFSPELSGMEQQECSELLDEQVRPYYRDYITNQKALGYQSLHITLYDHSAGCYTEVQLRTKDMDDQAEIGDANHYEYELVQKDERSEHGGIPLGECIYYDEAYERLQNLIHLDMSELDVNMFKAIDNYRVNDGCGLFRSRQILPFEHLSRFQND